MCRTTTGVRGGLFPFWVDASHPNDLEYIRLLLRSSSEGRHADGCARVKIGNRIATVINSAHGDHIPDHSYSVSAAEELSGSLRFLVELGAHASALDVNQDGIFTPGVDAESRYKLIWGIRDRGLTWAGHDPSYMDSRDAETAIVFQLGGQRDGGSSNGRSTQVDNLTLGYPFNRTGCRLRRWITLVLARTIRGPWASSRPGSAPMRTVLDYLEWL